jgi:Leucine-rich repeat (LRR) protein
MKMLEGLDQKLEIDLEIIRNQKPAVNPKLKDKHGITITKKMILDNSGASELEDVTGLILREESIG